MSQVFDSLAESYDRWYETPEGKAIFEAELKCLSPLRGQKTGHWLEVGTGTGRFARPLGITRGIDPSTGMLKFAAVRGIETLTGRAENLPFPDKSFDGVLMVMAFCFVSDSSQALKECRRVLHPGGSLLLGTVPADSPWGRAYTEKAAGGHPVYSLAHFKTAAEIQESARANGFTLAEVSSTLFWKPGGKPRGQIRVERGIIKGAGFLGLLFTAQ